MDQAEKIEASAAMKHLRLLLEADKQQTIDTLQRRIDDSHTDIDRLQEQLNVARADIARMQEKEMHAAEETARAIARALDVQRDTFEREKNAQLRWLKEDNQRLKIEASQTMGDTMERHKVYTDNQRQQYEEAKSILQGDKTRLEADRDQLRRELTDTLAKLAVERGTINERMKEERMQWEQELRDSRKEAVRMQAALRTEALTAMDRSKVWNVYACFVVLYYSRSCLLNVSSVSWLHRHNSRCGTMRDMLNSNKNTIESMGLSLRKTSVCRHYYCDHSWSHSLCEPSI